MTVRTEALQIFTGIVLVVPVRMFQMHTDGFTIPLRDTTSITGTFEILFDEYSGFPQSLRKGFPWCRRDSFLSAFVPKKTK